jgi:RNA polymerase sigma factor (sigma-70 family)
VGDRAGGVHDVDMAIDRSFDELILPHFNAAYRLARSFTHNHADAEDLVQDAAVRALRYFQTFSGGNARAWFLTIVRNLCCKWYGQRRRTPLDPFDEEQHGNGGQPPFAVEALMLQHADADAIARAMRRLPERLRIVLFLRELDGLSYREIADTLDMPIGTVMSSLSRARQRLRALLCDGPLNDQLPSGSSESFVTAVHAGPVTAAG